MIIVKLVDDDGGAKNAAGMEDGDDRNDAGTWSITTGNPCGQ